MPAAVIVDAVRTPSGRGKPGGALSGVHPVDLLGGLIARLLTRNDVEPDAVDDVIGGCVTQAGEQSANVTRLAALAAGLPQAVPAVTIDRQCGSSQQAAHFAAQAVMAGVMDVVVACGVESMSRVPLGSDLGDADPLGAAVAARYPRGLVNQGVAAELIAHQWKLDRDRLDEFAAGSHAKAATATQAGVFAAEIEPVPGTDLRADETIRPGTSIERLAGLPPAFRTDAAAAAHPELDWRVTAGNSSPLTDGAAAVLIMSEDRAVSLGLTPLARFHAFDVVGDDPRLMLTAPIPATRRVLRRAGLGIHDIDVVELSEAFAAVPLAWLQDTGADPERLNPCGGAIALGHPVGASGARLLTTLVHQMRGSGARWGLQVMCEGGGLANALVLERMG